MPKQTKTRNPFKTFRGLHRIFEKELSHSLSEDVQREISLERSRKLSALAREAEKNLGISLVL